MMKSDRSKKRQIGLLRIGVFISAVFIWCFIILLYKNTGTRDVEFDTVNQHLSGLINPEEMKDVSTRGLMRYYQLNKEDFEGVTMFIAKNGMSAKEYLLVKVKNENQLMELEQAIGKRMAARQRDFAGYAPHEEKLLKNARMEIRGTFLLYIVDDDTARFVNRFKQCT